MKVEKDGKEVKASVEEVNKGPTFGIRHWITVLLSLLISIAYAMRYNLSVAIVAMTDNTTSKNPDIPTYNWKNKSVVLSSFFWGYIVLQVFAGQVGRTYGTKWLLVGAMFINSTACMLIPLMSHLLGSYGAMGCRIIQGLSQGFIYPSVYNLLGRWVPPSERSRLGTIVFSGATLGTILTMPITGFISASWVGWPPTFYLFGALGCCWALIWAFFGADQPCEHKLISEAERNYIENSLGTSEDTQKTATPWKALATSLPAWATVVVCMGQDWGNSTLYTEMPNYMNKIMKFNMESNSLLSAAPYLAQLILSFVFAPISDYFINSGRISRGGARKLFNTIGSFVPAAALLILGFLPEDAIALSVIMLVITVGINSAICCGFLVNTIDLSPKFSGVLMSIGNTSSNCFSIIAPLAVQWIVTDETDKSLWRIIFIITSCMYTASNIFFIVFASGEVQWWNSIEDKETANSTTNQVREKSVKS